MANSVAVYNFKGGVGKTTTALNLGYSWSKTFKVLLIDFDPQCNLSASLSDHECHPTLFHYIKNILHNHDYEFDPIAVHPYLDVLPGDYLISQIESNPQFISFGGEIIYKLLQRLDKEYDIIIMDCPTNFGPLVKSILNAADTILVPAQADSFSLDGIKKVLTYIASIGHGEELKVLGVFFNMYASQLLLHQENFRKAKDTFGDLFLDNTISRSIKVVEATEMGKPIASFDPENVVSVEFNAMSEELLEKFQRSYAKSPLILPELLAKIGA